ncbi:MAG: Crp/Fnr family transcriptional regulator [Flavobacteriales bacterium]
MKELLKKELQRYLPTFSDEAMNLGLELFEEKTFKAKDLALETGNVCEDLIFAESSITRCFYHDQEGEEQTLWMKPEQTFVTDFKSFVHQAPSGFSIQMYEDTKVLCISRTNLLHLYQKSPEWAQFGVHLTEMLHVILIDVFVNLLANDATKNYQYIEYMFPRFIQVAPLKDIASMLQMSPTSLSRIRSGTQTKG